MSKWLQKLADGTPVDGHWRRLPMGHKGKGQGGEDQVGRTWVRKNNIRGDVVAQPHQVDFAKAFTRLAPQGGIIAAHGTGTGKTFGAIKAFEEAKGMGQVSRALVLTPSGLRNNFLDKGISRFTTSKGVILQRPQPLSEDTEYAIVSYDAFRRRPQEFIDAVKPDTLIADEVHRATNTDSKTNHSLRVARQQIPKFMGLTASVVQNNPEEIVPLLELAEGGKSPVGTKSNFHKTYVSRKVSKNKGIFGGKTYESELVRTAMLKARIGGAVHYVEDLDASQKPVEVDSEIQVPMSDDQVRQYHESMRGLDPVVLNKIRAGIPIDKPKELQHVFTRLLRARQVSNSLNTVMPITPAQAAEKTPKIKKILDDTAGHIKDTKDGQVVLYTNFVHGGVDALAEGLKARGVPFGIFAGRGVDGVTEESRQKAVNDYLEGKNRAIIITGAGAEGLSLGNTTLVQLVDGHYNPERINQAKARGIRSGGLAHRPLKDRKVEVRRYVSTLPKTFWQTLTFSSPEKSVEQFVYSTANRKVALNKQLRQVLAGRSEHERKKRESIWYRMRSRLTGAP